jgi:hypothetical protein
MAGPTFFLVGAMKAGTTSLHRYLAQHPDVFMSPVKEPSYFAFSGIDLTRVPNRITERAREVLDRTAYEELFAAGEHAPARGESSSLYLYVQRVPARIRACVPDARLVAVLREPVARAYSHYLAMVRDGHEKLPFAAALRAEDERVAAGWEELWHYRRIGRYDECVDRYLGNFPREQLLLLLYDDLVADPVAVTQRIFRFLGVDDTFRPDVATRANVGGLPAVPSLYRFLSWRHPLKESFKRFIPERLRRPPVVLLRRLLLRPPPPLPPQVGRELTREYRASVLRLQELLGRDLSHWLRE